MQDLHLNKNFFMVVESAREVRIF